MAQLSLEILADAELQLDFQLVAKFPRKTSKCHPVAEAQENSPGALAILCSLAKFW
jgi:hypothetical protein